MKKIPDRNLSPHGWWIASYVLRFVWNDEKDSPQSSCVAWENTILVQAPDRDEAFDKATRLGEAAPDALVDEADPGRTGYWRFEGLSNLLPIYDELKDGAEVLWVEHDDVPIKDVQDWIKGKRDLEVFDDTPAIGD